MHMLAQVMFYQQTREAGAHREHKKETNAKKKKEPNVKTPEEVLKKQKHKNIMRIVGRDEQLFRGVGWVAQCKTD